MGAFLLSLAAKVLPIIISAALGYGAIRAIGGKKAIDSVFNSATGADLTGAQVAQNDWSAQQAELSRDFNAAEAQKQRDFQLEMDNTKYQRTIADMQAAGVNPMLMMGGTISSASSGAAATGSPASPGSVGSAASMSELMALLQLPAQLKLLKAQTAKVNAETSKSLADAGAVSSQVAKNEAETRRTNVETDYFVDTADLRKESLELANSLTNAKERQVYKQIDLIESSIAKSIAETKSEENRSELFVAQKLLAEANARQVVEMLPYAKALSAAQTEQAKAQAALAAVNAAYQNKILDSTYLDDMFAEMAGRATSAQAKGEMEAIKASIRNGTYGNSNTGIKRIDGINMFLSHTLAGFVNFVDNLNPLAGAFK